MHTVTVRPGVGHDAAASEVGLWRAIRRDRGIRPAARQREQTIRIVLPATGHRCGGESRRRKTDDLGKKLRRRGHRYRDQEAVRLSIGTSLIV